MHQLAPNSHMDEFMKFSEKDVTFCMFFYDSEETHGN